VGGANIEPRLTYICTVTYYWDWFPLLRRARGRKEEMGLEPSAEDFNNLIVVEARQNRFYN
jgi:hypothetical protein